jgi:hypothetical protein
MTSDAPTPQIDQEPDEGEAAGGVDAVLPAHVVDPVIPDPPVSAQIDEDQVPDEIQQPEDTNGDKETRPDDAKTTEEPTG